MSISICIDEDEILDELSTSDLLDELDRRYNSRFRPKWKEEISIWVRKKVVECGHEPIIHDTLNDYFKEKAFSDAGFIYHSRITIWKDPVVEMQRTKALGLLHKQIKKDSTMSRVGIPDYVMIFRKDGERENPVTNTDLPVDLWQKYASPVWMDIDYGNTLQGYRNGRDSKDEKHICPLQLDTIERLIHLYSNKGDTVLTPFMGIGSEVFQAVKMDRKGIGFELKESYFQLSKKNLAACVEQKAQKVLFA